MTTFTHGVQRFEIASSPGGRSTFAVSTDGTLEAIVSNTTVSVSANTSVVHFPVRVQIRNPATGTLIYLVGVSA